MLNTYNTHNTIAGTEWIRWKHRSFEVLQIVERSLCVGFPALLIPTDTAMQNTTAYTTP
jgi:hypothetical protein